MPSSGRRQESVASLRARLFSLCPCGRLTAWQPRTYHRGLIAGHSHFKSTMHRKGRQDALKSKLFSKRAREITVVAKLRSPDPAMIPRVRLAVQAAKAESMPKDNI